MAQVVARLWALGLLAFLIALAVGHVRSAAPSERSKRIVVTLTAGSALSFLLLPEWFVVTALVQTGTGAYIVLHRMVTGWERELVEAEQPFQQHDGIDRTR
jgi:hypothetical protein